MKKKSYISTKIIILIPVFILGYVSVDSNILAVTNIKRVNANATQIANGYMSCISELGDIQKETLLIHRLGLSHIVATDLNTMISLVETIRSEQETLETYLDDFQEQGGIRCAGVQLRGNEVRACQPHGIQCQQR